MQKPRNSGPSHPIRSDRLRPLDGVVVLVTRPPGLTVSLTEPLERLGAKTMIQPMIRILPPEDGYVALDDAIRRSQAGVFDWIVFASANGVRAFDERRRALALTLPDRMYRVAAIGAGTASELEQSGYHVDRIPEKAESGALADAMEPEARRGERFLMIRANRGRDLLPRKLTEWGARVESVTAYRSVDVTRSDPGIPADLSGIDLVTVTSSAIAVALVRIFGESLRRVDLISISPVTSATLRNAGYPPAAEATRYTMPGVVDAILRLREKRSDGDPPIPDFSDSPIR
ncbi:MAG: uroporphyrinogen-III synthase [Planctomycetia bacterium]|nr:uroporphyrinogen-III synthase [Planctomycetia bacterium]